jgi:L-lactate dehydrogenase complex protein LldG
MPTYGDDEAVARVGLEGSGSVRAFADQLARAGGRSFLEPAALVRWLVERGDVRGYCDPTAAAELGPALSGDLVLETKFVRARMDEYRFGITLAAGAIAETGTVILNDATTSARLAALAPWIHIAIVRKGTIHRCLADAVRALGADPYVVWCTGPSKTADVEGILIEGVHGPGEQVALIVPAKSETLAP